MGGGVNRQRHRPGAFDRDDRYRVEQPGVGDLPIGGERVGDQPGIEVAKRLAHLVASKNPHDDMSVRSGLMEPCSTLWNAPG